MAEFTGFPVEGIAFLNKLPGRDKAWFQEHKALYQEALVEPSKAFVEAIGERLRAEVSGGLVAQPRTNGSIAPINNDVRFSKDKSPYKDHLLFRFWEGRDKKTAPTLYVRLSPESIGFATGAAFASVDRWRLAVADDAAGGALAAAIAKLSKGRALEVAGAELKRVPAPYTADHPRADLLRHKWLQLRWPEPAPKAIGSTRFADWCMTRLKACQGVHEWLVRSV
jgi:uncharacterized protein (TIGR02453 family)